MRWWPFRSRSAPWQDVVEVGEPSTSEDDYTILTVGQSRLGDSFRRLGLGPESPQRRTPALLTPIIDERLGVAADVTVAIDGHIVGYLRPPTVREVMSTRETRRANVLQVPALLQWSPAGPEVRLRPWTADGD